MNEPAPRLAWAMWKRFLLAGAIIFTLSAAATATAGLLEVSDIARVFREQPALELGDEITRAEVGDPRTLLLLGSDERYIDRVQKNPVRSDTIILVRLDPDRAATTMLNIPRDQKVEIPGYGTDKINAAYALGGPKLTLKTVKQMLGIDINHVVTINFGGFRRAVNRLGCVYVDVDRRYFNDNSGGGPDYATINVQPGYQQLCGKDALDYVRYRHEDTDLVRAARQQDFLRQAKDQVGVNELISDRKALAKIIGRYTQTDKSLRKTRQIISLLKLAIYSRRHPISEVHWVATATRDGVYLESSDKDIQRMVNRFMTGKASKGPRGTLAPTAAEEKLERRKNRRKSRRRQGVLPGLQEARKPAEDLAIASGRKVDFPFYYPTLATVGAQYGGAHTYSLRDTDRKRHRAYRIWVKKGNVGEYYGIQGTTWRDPAILEKPTKTQTIDGRKFLLFFDGNRLRIVAWRTPKAVYWVSNTLLQSIGRKQMLAIANSLRRLGT